MANTVSTPSGSARTPSPTADWFSQQGLTNQPVSTGSGTAPGTAHAPTPDEVLAVVSSFPPTYDGARQADAELQKRYGANAPKLLDHPTKLDKWQFADGTVYDLMNGAGGPNASWVTHAAPDSGGHGGGTIGALAGATGQGVGGAMGGIDPSYGFVFGQGLKALEASAASKGTLLTGPHLEALTRYGQGMASTEFGNIFDRNYKLAGLGLNATSGAVNAGSAYGNNATDLANNFGANQTNLTNQYGINDTNLALGGANATATGQVAGANNLTGTIGNLADIWGQYLAKRSLGQSAARPDPNPNGGGRG